MIFFLAMKQIYIFFNLPVKIILLVYNFKNPFTYKDKMLNTSIWFHQNLKTKYLNSYFLKF